MNLNNSLNEKEIEELVEEEIILRPLDFLLRIIFYMPIKSDENVEIFNELKDYILQDMGNVEKIKNLLKEKNYSFLLNIILEEIKETYCIKNIDNYEKEKNKLIREVNELFIKIRN